MSLLANSNAIESGGYPIQRSLRFRSSASAYLNRTPASAGNRKTWTWSGWVKRGALGGTTTDYTIFRAGTAATDSTDFSFSANGSGDVFYFRNRVASTNQFSVQTTQVFRDVSSWYHIVVALDTTQATASDRYKLYVNGVQVTSFTTATYGAQNSDSYVNAANVHYVGATTGPASYLDGYLAEVNFIDGQALTPSSFGYTEPLTGVWQPLKYMGTYGTNGFYLPFSDNTSATTLAYDKSGNSNNWTANNISTTAGATYDSMTDVPTLTSATAANYCVLNPLNIGSGSSLTSANLNFTTSSSSGNVQQAQVFGSLGVSSGKWYWEILYSSANTAMVGVCNASQTPALNQYVNNYIRCYQVNGNKESGTASTAYGATWTSGDVIGIALDIDSGTITFYKNNVSQGTAFSDLVGNTWFPYATENSSGVSSSGNINFGQRPFSYTPPTGFVALNTFNLPDPTIKKPNQYMDVSTWTGDNAVSRSITGVAFNPDFVWAKQRNGTGIHLLWDSVRAGGLNLQSQSTDAEYAYTSLVAGGVSGNTTGGFTVAKGSVDSNYVNGTGGTYVGWQWKESATAGFDIVTYTFGSTGIATINHNLGVVPKMIIAKRKDSAEAWLVYHNAATTQSQYLMLNSTAAVTTSANLWGSSAITSSQFYLNGTSGYQYVFYLFAEIPGFSKFGSYTGNGSADGLYNYLGFRPKLIMWKRTDSTGDWIIFDSSRDTYNYAEKQLVPNTSGAEQVTSGGFVRMDLLSNGFKVRSTDSYINASGGTYIYAAFAENPFKYSNAR